MSALHQMTLAIAVGVASILATASEADAISLSPLPIGNGCEIGGDCVPGDTDTVLRITTPLGENGINATPTGTAKHERGEVFYLPLTGIHLGPSSLPPDTFCVACFIFFHDGSGISLTRSGAVLGDFRFLVISDLAVETGIHNLVTGSFSRGVDTLLASGEGVHLFDLGPDGRTLLSTTHFSALFKEALGLPFEAGGRFGTLEINAFEGGVFIPTPIPLPGAVLYLVSAFTILAMWRGGGGSWGQTAHP